MPFRLLIVLDNKLIIYYNFTMKVLANGKRSAAGDGVRPDINHAIELVRGFVQMWIKYEAAMHNEVAAMQREGADSLMSAKLHTYLSNGHFYKVSSTIAKYRSPTMSELSTALSVPFSTATRIVDGMVADGYIKRLHDPDDRRIVKVALTARGQQLHNLIEKSTGEHVQQILSCLKPEEQDRLFELIGKVMNALEKAT